jgi:hypothetical protein
VLWIRIRIDFFVGWIRTQQGKKEPQKEEKSEGVSCFDVLD